jgi:hypothetical protein
MMLNTATPARSALRRMACAFVLSALISSAIAGVAAAAGSAGAAGDAAWVDAVRAQRQPGSAL